MGRRAPRRPLLGDRHHSPPPRTSLAEAGIADQRTGQLAAQDVAQGRQSGEARWTARLLHVLARAGGGRGAGVEFLEKDDLYQTAPPLPSELPFNAVRPEGWV